MSEDLGEEDIVGDVFELNMWQQMAPQAEGRWPGFQGSSREPKAAETYLGSWGPVVALTALGEGKLLRSRRVSRAWISFLGSARTGMR